MSEPKHRGKETQRESHPNKQPDLHSLPLEKLHQGLFQLDPPVDVQVSVFCDGCLNERSKESDEMCEKGKEEKLRFERGKQDNEGLPSRPLS